MWVEQHKSGKVNFIERYKNPYTEKWARVSVLMEKDTTRIRKEAQKQLEIKIANILNDLESSEMLFTELFDQWWTFYQQEIKRSSIASLSGNIKEIKSDFGVGIKVSNIDPKYIQRRAKLPRVKKSLEDWKKVEQKYLEEDEIKILLKELYRRPSTYRIGLLSEFMSLNGCRIGEAVGIEPHNVDYESNILQLHGTYDHTNGYQKGEKTSPKTLASYRETVMTTREKEILEEMEFMNELEKNTNPRYKDMGFIFTTKNGVPLQTNSFNLALKKANERLETPIQKNLTSHIFRHTLVSRLSENNVPLKAIMDRVAHSDAKTTTQIYTHITKQMKSTVADVMEKY